MIFHEILLNFEQNHDFVLGPTQPPLEDKIMKWSDIFSCASKNIKLGCYSDVFSRNLSEYTGSLSQFDLRTKI